jgi:bifunctional non-homologous end joining protein LigD
VPLSFPVAPMKAAMGSIPNGDDAAWAYEIKWDGHRTLAHVDNGAIRFQSSAGHDITNRWPDVVGLAEAVGSASAILDGEMVVIDNDGRPSFDLVQKRADVRRHPAVFQIFDVLQISGIDAISLPYLDRRRLLNELVTPATNWAVPAHRIGGGTDLLAATLEQGLEGIIAKRIDSTYRPGTRSKEWLKIKNRRCVELVVGGYTIGTGNRSSTFGSLLVGIDGHATHDPELARVLTSELSSESAVRFVGGVGTGFDHATLDSMIQQLRALTVDDSPFDGPVPATIRRTARWVHPTLRIVVEIAEFTNGGIARHASFVEVAR